MAVDYDDHLFLMKGCFVSSPFQSATDSADEPEDIRLLPDCFIHLFLYGVFKQFPNRHTVQSDQACLINYLVLLKITRKYYEVLIAADSLYIAGQNSGAPVIIKIKSAKSLYLSEALSLLML